ncbi:MAG TPA: transglutaminase domain-containing protein [Thermomicrobiales bacterium]
MVSTAIGRNAVSQTPVRPARRSPAEGWVSVALHAALLVMMADEIGRVGRSERVGILVPLALGGGAIGLALAKTRSVDLLAHFGAFVFGVAAAVGMTAVHYGDVGGGWRESLHRLDVRAERLYRSLQQSKPLDDDLLVAVIGITIWLVGYSSAWMLYRRRWLGPSVMLPGVVILTSLGLDRDASAAPIFAYLLLAMVLAARHFAFRRQQDWRRARIAAPPALPNRFLSAGVVIATLAVSIGIVLPVQAPDSVLDSISDRADQTWRQVERQWNRLSIGGSGDRVENYSKFPDTFRIGAPINLGHDPVAILTAGPPSYLAVRRYNVYDGHNWSTDVDDTFRLPGDGKGVRATRATFEPAQPVTLSPAVSRDREPETAVIHVLRQTDGLIFTIDTYSMTSEKTAALLGWRKLDDFQIPLDSVDASTVPVDLYSLIALLQQAKFTPDPNGGEPSVAQADLALQIGQLRGSLRQQYPLETRLELVNGKPVLHVSGRLPNYDDIEAVYAGDPSGIESQYLVTGLRSVAEPGDLRAAGVDYPQYVKDRYLQLPGTVTARTRDLAAQVVGAAGTGNAFDEAIAIQDYLRTTYAYDLNSPPPNENLDFVDDFLFESKVGRCEHFATAMVVLMRSLGVPARLVSGYHVGDYDPSAQGYVYRGDQAHTWVEVYYPEYGWIPFEPTPSEDAFAYGPDAAKPAATPSAMPTPMPTPVPTPTVAAQPSPVAGPIDTGGKGQPFYRRLFDGLTWLPALVGLVTLGLILGLVVAWLWGLRGLRPGAALYARALRVARFWGVRPDPTMTPGEFASEFGRSVPAARTAIRAVAEIYTKEQYGTQGASSVDLTAGRSAWHELRASLLRWRPWRRRRVATGRRRAIGD